MAIRVEVEVIKPKLADTKKFMRRLNQELVKEGKAHRRALSATTSSWEGAKPTFKSSRVQDAGNVSVQTTATGNQDGVQKWFYLDEGTSVRHALMPPDFSPKTRPGRLLSRAGGPGPVRISRDVNRPGIEARGWSVKVQATREPRFQDNIDKAVADTATFGE